MTTSKDISTELLSGADKRQIAFQGILKGIPYIGESLNHFIFAQLDEIRWKRVERTLVEVAENVKKLQKPTDINERFARILEDAIPSVAKETIEQKRLAYVSLLTNSLSIDTDEKEEEARLALETLQQLSAVAVDILAGAIKAKGIFSVASHPAPQVYAGKFDEKEPENQVIFHQLNYQWPVVEVWARRMKDKRIITYGSHGKYGFHGGGVMLLGQLVNDWCIKQEENA